MTARKHITSQRYGRQRAKRGVAYVRRGGRFSRDQVLSLLKSNGHTNGETSAPITLPKVKMPLVNW